MPEDTGRFDFDLLLKLLEEKIGLILDSIREIKQAFKEHNQEHRGDIQRLHDRVNQVEAEVNVLKTTVAVLSEQAGLGAKYREWIIRAVITVVVGALAAVIGMGVKP